MMMQTIARAEALWPEHQHTLQRRLGAAVEASDADLTPAERRRAERFASNIAHRTRTYHSEATHFAYPGLREFEFHDPEGFPWLRELEGLTPTIRAGRRAGALRQIQRQRTAGPVARFEPQPRLDGDPQRNGVPIPGGKGPEAVPDARLVQSSD